jgi:DNA-binding CsgD family transcriptional regulator
MARWPGHVERTAARVVNDTRLPIAALVASDGTGRTETLACVVEVLEGLDVTTVRVAGRRADRDVRFAALEELFEGKVPGKGSAGERAGRTQVAERCAGAVLMVDDAHWLDDASRRVVAALAEEAGERDLGVVVATRPPVRRDDDVIVGAFARSGTVVEPDPLAEGDVAERAARVVGRAVDDATVDTLFEQTSGHARLVDTLAAAWPDDGDLAQLPAAAADTVVASTSDLSPEAREALVALALGTGPDDELLASLVGVGPKDVPGVWSELDRVGVLTPGHGEPIAVVAAVVESRTDAATRRDVHRRLAELLAARGAPAAHVAEHLVASEARGSDAAATLIAAGEAQLADAPEIAAELFDRAVEAGADAAALGGARAEAAALAGDEDGAVALADAAMGGPPESVARAAIVLAGVLARRGLWARAVRAYDTTTGHPNLPDDAIRALGAVGGVAIGRAATDLADAAAAPGTLGADVARLLGDVAIAMTRGDAVAARRAAGEAADLLEVGTTPTVLPETPHALGALVGLVTGDSDGAELLASRALEAGVGGPAAAMRHRLLAGLAALRAGRYDRAQRVLDDARGPGTTRDALLRAALSVGLARRLGDVGRLTAAWEAATPAIAAVRGDLYLLPALTELGVAAARLRQRDAINEREHELDAVVESLDRPGLWMRPLAWARVEAAVATDDQVGLDAAITALQASPPAHPRLEGLNAAAEAWRGIVTGDATGLDTGVEGLEQAGLVWEASRLVGHAAIRADDADATRSLLGRARELHGTLPVIDESGAPTGTVLSTREREVAACVVDGLTHKEIGAMLFISPKTVEHHVARIRQKLGASTRAEMLAGLRTTLAAADT